MGGKGVSIVLHSVALHSVWWDSVWYFKWKSTIFSQPVVLSQLFSRMKKTKQISAEAFVIAQQC